MNQPQNKNRRLQNTIRGWQNRNSGKEFETIINTTCVTYEKLRLAKIEKTPEPMKILESLGNGRFKACFEKKAQPDFKGTLSGGSSVVFEAKYTSSTQMSQNVVTSNQTDALTLHAELGAKCSILLSFGNELFFRIPVGVWQNMKEIYGRKYITPLDIKQYRVPIRNGVVDFLNLM